MIPVGGGHTRTPLCASSLDPPSPGPAAPGSCCPRVDPSGVHESLLLLGRLAAPCRPPLRQGSVRSAPESKHGARQPGSDPRVGGPGLASSSPFVLNELRGSEPGPGDGRLPAHEGAGVRSCRCRSSRGIDDADARASAGSEDDGWAGGSRNRHLSTVTVETDPCKVTSPARHPGRCPC